MSVTAKGDVMKLTLSVHETWVEFAESVTLCSICIHLLSTSHQGFFFLCQVEKRLELVKQVSHSTHKKLTACLQGQQGVDVDKKSVRSPSVRSSPDSVEESAQRHFNNNITKVLGVDKAGRGKVRTPSKSFNYIKCDNKSRRLIIKYLLDHN